MPKWLLPYGEGNISFMASKDLYENLLGLAFAVVFEVKEGKKDVEFQLLANVNGEKTREESKTFRSLDLDHMWLDCRKAKLLWGGDAVGPNDWSHFQFSIRVSREQFGDAIVKKFGFRLICKLLENDLEVLLQEDQSLDPPLIYKVWHEDSQTSSEEESSSETED